VTHVAGAQLVGAGTWRLAVPLPLPELPFVNVHALETADGLILIDAGWNSAEAAEALATALSSAGFQPGDIALILLTHVHPDHCGLVAWLKERADAEIWVHEAELRFAERLTRQQAEDGLRGEWLEETCAPADLLGQIRGSLGRLRNGFSLPPLDSTTTDFVDVDLRGRDLVAIPTPGHSPGHVCFFDRETGLLFSGDHILPQITPNVGYHAGGPPDPLGDFLRSCEALRGLDPVSVLPGHEWVFQELDHRLDELLEHHRERLNVIASLVDGGAETVWGIAEALGWLEGPARTSHMALAALAEVWAHLIFLENEGRVVPGSGPKGARHWRASRTGKLDH
jgi:glyoxylase-like metal-dependent hydrolase (beta-lactamase superfamily II)